MESCPDVEKTLQQKLRALCPALVLASQSPNRLRLLRDAGIEVTPCPQDICEICGSSDPETVVRTLSRQKLESYLACPSFRPDVPAVAVDTLVCLDGKLLGKPADEAEAHEMLSRLSGRTHEVFSGMSVYRPGSGNCMTVCDVSYVKFKPLTEEDIRWYISMGDPVGAAGAYKIQRNGFELIESISGSVSNIIGLPMEMLADIMAQ